MHELQESTGLSSESLSDYSETPLARPKDDLSYWHDHFKRWEKSGLSQAAYCRCNDLKYCLFHYWKRKLSKPSQPSVQSDTKTMNFVEVGTPLPFSSGYSLRTAPGDFFRLWVGGICVEVGNNFDPPSLSQLLRCLRTL
jgi:hypothetical protein